MSNILTTDDLKNAKEKQIELKGYAGRIEAVFNGADLSQSTKPLIAILGHPHSLHGGAMNNKVITTLAKACRESGIPSLRFNFRGVGESEGAFDKGIGESEDLLLIMSEIKRQFPEYAIILAGFSFGAFVTYRAACQSDPALLISVAPAVNHGDFSEFEKVPAPWHVLVANADEIVNPEEILDWHKTVEPQPVLHQFEETSHFFHGKLVILRETVKQIFSQI